MRGLSKMGEQREENIIVNDLLSFLTCKAKSFLKEELLKIINDYYSDSAIVEAHKALLAALPIKKSTRHGRRVKHPDPLVAIYDCIQLVPKDDLPIFVCRDLNNVPHVLNKENQAHNVNNPVKKLNLSEDLKMEGNLSRAEENFEIIDEKVFKKEQKQMRSQISQMFAIITELKDGLQKLSENQTSRNAAKFKQESKKQFDVHGPKIIRNQTNFPSLSRSKKGTLEFIDKSDLDESSMEKNSKLEGLALIQKLIDEDDEENAGDSLVDVDPLFDDSPDSRSEFDEMEDDEETFPPIENYDYYDSRYRNSRHIMSRASKKNTSSKFSEGETSPYERNETSRINSIEKGLDDRTDQTDSMKDDPLSLDEMDNSSEEVNGVGSDGNAVKRCRTRYLCHYCLEHFTSFKKVRKHMNSCHRTLKARSWECVLCDAKFPDSDKIREHFRQCIEKNKEKYKKNICQICNTYYASEKALKQHRNLHEEFRPHSCPHCPFKYLNKAILDLHMKNQHSIMNSYECPFCFYSSIKSSTLMKHMKVHTGQKDFECRICGQRMKTKFLLKRHIELHGPLRERKCDKCDFICVGLNEYLRHRRKAHGKPIVCHICKQSFMHSNSFVRHYNSHTQKKPYKCDLCTYRGAVKEALRLHKLTHRGSDLQLCPACNVPCGSRRTLSIHLQQYCKNRQKKE